MPSSCVVACGRAPERQAVTCGPGSGLQFLSMSVSVSVRKPVSA